MRVSCVCTCVPVRVWLTALCAHVRVCVQTNMAAFDDTGYAAMLVGASVLCFVINVGMLAWLVRQGREVGDEMRKEVVQEEVDDDEFIILRPSAAGPPVEPQPQATAATGPPRRAQVLPQAAETLDHPLRLRQVHRGDGFQTAVLYVARTGLGRPSQAAKTLTQKI